MTNKADPLGISVVLVTFNSAHCVEQCLASIAEQLAPDEIIVEEDPRLKAQRMRVNTDSYLARLF